MEEENGKIEWKSTEWKNGMGNRMEMVEMVDCNGWPFSASVLEFNCVTPPMIYKFIIEGSIYTSILMVKDMYMCIIKVNFHVVSICAVWK